MNIAQASLKLASAKVGHFVVTFVGTAFFAQQLGATSLGIFFLFQAVLGILTIPANLGTRIAVEKRISEGGPADRIFSTGIILKSVLLSLVVMSIAISSPYINDYIGREIAVFLAIAIVLHEFSGLMMNVLKGELRVGETATLQLAYSISWVSIGVVFTILGYGVMGLIYGVIIGKAIQFSWAVYKTTVGIGYPSITQAHSLVDYAKYSIIPEVDNEIHSWMDILIIGFFLTQAAVGAYEVAWRVAGPVLLLTSAIGMTIFPQISSWEGSDSIESLERLFPKIITPSLFFVFPAFFGGMLLSQEILGLIFGEEFTAAWLALIILLLAKFPRAIRKIAGKSLLGLNRPDLVTRAAVLDIVANLILNILLIWQLGILGAALGTTLSMTLGTVCRMYYLSQFIEMRIPYNEVAWCFISSMIMAATLYVLKTMFEITTVFHLMVFIFVGAILYMLVIFSYRPLRMSIFDGLKSTI